MVTKTSTIPMRWMKLNDSFYPHVEGLYEAMTEEIVEKRFINGVRKPVYQGLLTRTAARADLPNSYYSPVLAVLKQMGCIAQIKRGGRYMQSEWVLLGKPTKRAFSEAARLLQPGQGDV